MDGVKKVGAHKVEMAIPVEKLATSTPFDNSERRSTFVASKDDKENAGLRKGPKKKWNVNPDLSAILPPWSECNGKDASCKDTVASTLTKASSTVIICKRDVDSVAEQGVKLKPNIQRDRTGGNHGPVNISNNVNATKQSDKKDVRKSLQEVSKAKVEKKGRVQQRRSTGVRRVTTNRPAAGLPQQRLTLKKLTTSIKHKEPLPYACRSTLYDEHWVSKQERAFTKWLNYMLASTNCYGNSIPSNQKNYEASTKYVDNTGQLQFKDKASVNHIKISPLESYHKEARLWQSARLLYQSLPLEEVFLKLELEIETGRLSMRLDRTIYSDIGLRQQLIELLNSYNAPWLKLGVEVLFDEALPMFAVGEELVDFGVYCVKKLCENDNISRTHMYKTGTHRPGYKVALLKFVYRNLLMMVNFLDKAKMEKLMDNNPCLFVKTANVKSSKQVLLILSDIFLCGEGDVIKHLRLLGYTVHHIQCPFDEYDFTVTNLATDLRDGVRLCRLTEILTNNWELSGQLRVPAVSKTQVAWIGCQEKLTWISSSALPQDIIDEYEQGITRQENIEINHSYGVTKHTITTNTAKSGPPPSKKAKTQTVTFSAELM